MQLEIKRKKQEHKIHYEFSLRPSNRSTAEKSRSIERETAVLALAWTNSPLHSPLKFRLQDFSNARRMENVCGILYRYMEANILLEDSWPWLTRSIKSDEECQILQRLFINHISGSCLRKMREHAKPLSGVRCSAITQHHLCSSWSSHTV